MKKLLTLLLTLLMVFTLVGCNSKEDTPVVQETVQQEEVVEPKEDETILGGFIEAEDKTLTDELKEIFNKAIEGYVGMSLSPERLEGTQVVAGTNYKFLASGTKTTNPPIKGSYFVTVYEDLEGNCSIIDVETVTESAGDVDGDPSQYKYWVVFKNPDGNELQRTIEKYGATPVYTGDTPVYWDSENWYRFTNWDKELKPITGNTYITAEYEFGGELQQEEEPAPAPEPPACLAAGTMITMADGSRKPIESLQKGDDIRVFDHNTGEVSNAKIMDYWQYEEKKSGLITLHFTNDIDVSIVDAHGFFNKQDNKYVIIRRENVNDYIGKQFYNADNASWETLLGVTYYSKPVDTFFIATEGEYNCVAEGMLNVEDDIYSLIVNIFDYDDEMKVDKQKKAIDILKYGLFDYDDAPYLTKEGFDAFKIAYIKVAIGKGIITKEQWDAMVEENLSYESPHVSNEYADKATKHQAR